MKDFIFTPVDGKSKEEDPEGNYPKILEEALQVFECTWMDTLEGAQDDKVQDEYDGPYHDFNGITSKYGAHFILRIDHILMKQTYRDAIVEGATRRNFCPLPTNWGYRDSKDFWCSDYSKPKPLPIPNRQIDLSSLRYAADRLNTDVKFTDDALATIVKVPRPFLKLVLQGCVKWADENGVKLITEKEMKIISDKRANEKKKK